MQIGFGIGIAPLSVHNVLGGFVGALDALSPAAAYSTRLLRSDYTGPCMRVRRSSDNAEADIGFTGAGNLDTTALLAHCGAAAGFVTTWYDQSGNARDAVQATAGNQPRIVNAGTVETINGRPCIRSHATSAALPAWKFAVPGTNWTFNAVASRNSTGANNQNALGSDGMGFNANGFYLQFTDNGAVAFFSRSGATTGAAAPSIVVAAGQNQVTTVTHTSGNVARTFGQGSAGSPTTAMTWTTGAFSDFRIGPYASGSPATVNLLGTYQELLAFPSVLSAPDRQTIERNQGAYYGITVA